MSDGKHMLTIQENYCVRCRTRPGVYSCSKCDANNNFCDQCDYYIHSMSSKKNHQRIHLSKIIPSDRHDTDQNYYSGQNFNKSSYKLENNHIKSFSNLPLDNQSLISLNAMNPSRLSTNPQTLYDLTSKSINKFNLNSQDKLFRSSSNEKLYDRKENTETINYSKEYIQEIKCFHDTEKRELILKNNKLLESIENMKSEFQGQITELHNQVEECHQKNQINLSVIEEENQMKLKKILSEKENELKIIYQKLKEQEDINQNLMTELSNKTSFIQEIKYKYHESFNELDYNLSQNEKEFLNMKDFYENKIGFLETHYVEEKTKIINKYEENIQNLLNGHNKSKEKLNSIIKERELDIKVLIDKANSEQKILRESNAELKKLLEEEKYNKNEIINQLSVKESEIEILNRNVDKLKKENKDYMNQIKIFNNENRGLIEEKEDLKGKLTKFDAIVYGKLKKKK